MPRGKKRLFMVFSSLPFVFFFLPLCLILYYPAPFWAKNHILLLFSLVFYAWGEPVYILLMLLVTLSDYTAGRLMERAGAEPGTGKRRAILLAAVAVDLFCLGFFKYADFLVRTANALVFGRAGQPLPLVVSLQLSLC